MRRRAPRAPLLPLLGIAAWLSGCGPSDETLDVGAGTPLAKPPPPVPAGLDDGTRLGQPPEPSWNYDTPEGWTPLPPAEMRELAWSVAGHEAAECTFSVLPGPAGGPLANLNRWRDQMSLPPVDAEGLEALPKGVFFGRPAYLVDLAGTYVGMRKARRDEGWRLLGLIAEIPEAKASAFLKLVGPAALVEAEHTRFEVLAGSLSVRRGQRGAHPAAPPARTSKAPFSWTLPAGWSEAQARPALLANFKAAGAPGADISLSRFPGDVGGLHANVSRWRGEMGLPPLADGETPALPRLSALGVSAQLVELDGTFGGGMSLAKIPGARMLALLIPRASDTVFVKIVGPADEVRREEANFKAFCESLRE